MNTSKQVNTMIGLLFIGALATLLYFLWEGDRQSAATERQLTTNAERGGRLFSLNCRACHGLNGLGALESSDLPGLPLNTDANREADKARQDYIRATIACGRVGTRMPPWAVENGGSLNFFQIDQLVALITGTMTGFDQDPAASTAGWEYAIEQANHADAFVPAKHIQEAINADTDTLVLDNPRNLNTGQYLRIDDDPETTDYEVVTVVSAPAGSALAEEAGTDDEELVVDDGTVFEVGDIIIVDKELMEVLAAPARSVLASDLVAAATSVEVADGAGFEADETVQVGAEKMRIVSVSGDTLDVVRAVDGTQAVDHTADSPIFETGVSDKLTNDVTASDTTIVVEDGGGFLEGQVLRVGREKMLVTSVSGDELEVERGYDDTKARDHAAGAPLEQVTDVLRVKRGVEDTDAQSHEIKTTVFEVGSEVTVERGTFGTQAAEHETGTQVFNGPITPPDTITGGSEGYPPCGQLPAQTGGGGATEVEVSGTADVSLNDNFFDSDGNQNPNFKVAAGTPVTFSLANNGAAPHNMRIAGTDGEFETDDDVVSDPDLIPAGGTGTLEFTAPAGTYDYECQFHPDQMNGQIIAE